MVDERPEPEDADFVMFRIGLGLETYARIPAWRYVGTYRNRESLERRLQRDEAKSGVHLRHGELFDRGVNVELREKLRRLCRKPVDGIGGSW